MWDYENPRCEIDFKIVPVMGAHIAPGGMPPGAMNKGFLMIN